MIAVNDDDLVTHDEVHVAAPVRVALLRYLGQHVVEGGCWPEVGRLRGAGGLWLDNDWTTELHLKLARALDKIARA